MKDPFEAAACEETESPPDSPIPNDDGAPLSTADGIFDEDDEPPPTPPPPCQQQQQAEKGAGAALASKGKKEEENMEGEEEEENVSNVIGDSKFQSDAGPEKVSKMQTILAQFTGEQMSRYESFRRSGFQKSNMRRLLTNITGSQKISMPMTIVVSGIAKMLVGELIETSRTVMMERKESGPIRPCHIREAYRRLKLEGKIPRRSVPRLFR